MAHRTNVVQVQKKFRPQETQIKTILDPVCGKVLQPEEARHMVFRGDLTYYFCSKECEKKFQTINKERSDKKAG